MTLTPREARIELYNHPVIGPGLGMYGTATSITATVLTDIVKLGSGLYGPNTFNGLASIILPNRSGTEREKVAGALAAGGALSPAPVTNTWAGYTNEPYEIIWGAGRRKLSINHLVQAGVNAMREVYFMYYGPVSPWLTAAGINNGDFSDGVAEWLASGASLSITQSDDRAHNINGFSSMLLTNTSGADRYVYHSVGIPVQEFGVWWLSVVAKIIAGSGTLEVDFWDATATLAGVTQVGDTMEAAGPGSVFHLGQQVEIPADCTRLNMRIRVPTGMTVAVTSVPGHDLDAMMLVPPDWITANFRLHSINEMEYGRSLSQFVQAATTRNPTSWEPRIDYAVLNEAESANPGGIQILKAPGRRIQGRLPTKDLWFAGLRQESDRVTFENESDVYNGSVDLYMAAYIRNIAEMLEGRDELGANGKWRVLERASALTLASQRIVREQREIVAPAPLRHRMSV